MGVGGQKAFLQDTLDYEPRELGFGTSGRRGRVIDLKQLEIYINVLAELEYLQSLDPSAGGIVRGEKFFFAYDLRPSSTRFVAEFGGRGEIAQAMVVAIGDAGMPDAGDVVSQKAIKSDMRRILSSASETVKRYLLI